MQNKRVMLKLSGEALAKPEGGYNEEKVRDIAKQLKPSLAEGCDIGIVIGGGNYWRGRTSEAIDRTKADQIGMLATIMNCIYVSEIFRSEGIDTAIYSAFTCGDMAELFSKDKALRLMKKGTVLFLAGGTGHPYFSTDTGVVLRALELSCEEILLAKAVDGVYDKDPKKDRTAQRYDTIPLRELVDKRLEVIDLAASVLCLENHLPLAVFSLREKHGISNALRGKINGTRVTAV